MNDFLAYFRDRFLELDRLLRGDATRPDAIAGQTLDLSARRLGVFNGVMFAVASLAAQWILRAHFRPQPAPSTTLDRLGRGLRVRGYSTGVAAKAVPRLARHGGDVSP